MCTVTWRHEPGGCQVFFNRDEQREREPAAAPALHVCNGVRYLAALDGRAGGTWLAANEHGVVIGLLNYYEAEAVARKGLASRGLLVTSLMDVREASAIGDRLSLDLLRSFGPFLMLVWAAGQPVQLHRWDCARRIATVLRDEEMPVTTSSFDTEAVLSARRAKWEYLRQIVPAASMLLHTEFHRSTDARGGAYSVFMTRPDAMTVSYSRVRVEPERITYYYAPRGSEDRILPMGHSLVMARG